MMLKNWCNFKKYDHHDLIGDKELSVLFRVAAFLKKHIFLFHTNSYQPHTSQHRLSLQTLLHTCRQISRSWREPLKKWDLTFLLKGDS